MITEKQKQILFDINCFYQLAGLTVIKKEGQPMEFCPEILIYISFHTNDGKERIAWNLKYEELKKKLRKYGFSRKWIGALLYWLDDFVNENGNRLLEFRDIFWTATDLLSNMIIAITNSLPISTSREYIVKKVIGDVFDTNYWEGTTMEQIKLVRKLTEILNFERDFVDEFGKVFIRLD